MTSCTYWKVTRQTVIETEEEDIIVTNHDCIVCSDDKLYAGKLAELQMPKIRTDIEVEQATDRELHELFLEQAREENG
jgi:hypothetical protein